MKCLMPLNQRRAIAEAIEGRRYVEWGVGGTSAWLAENARPAEAWSIEHDEHWLARVEPNLPHPWSIQWRPCTPGDNASAGEEHADDADDYVFSGAALNADVYLVDGVVRSRCLRAVIHPTATRTIFIHDTQRDWYDDAIAEAIDAGFVRTDYPEGEDYPGCLLTRLEKK